MKTSKDPRHQKRIEAVKSLFAHSFTKQEVVSPLVKQILSKRKKIDMIIQKAAPVWPIENLNRIDLAILRLAVFELKNTKNPPKVIIDEAVELAKEFGSESSPSFVNGVLATIYKSKKGKYER